MIEAGIRIAGEIGKPQEKDCGASKFFSPSPEGAGHHETETSKNGLKSKIVPPAALI